MPDLFQEAAARYQAEKAPLADRMRPRTLDEFVGQPHILGPGKLLRRAIEADRVTSLIFYGPPGSGKTTLARIIAGTTKAHFTSMNAVLSGVKDIRAAIKAAQERLRSADPEVLRQIVAAMQRDAVAKLDGLWLPLHVDLALRDLGHTLFAKDHA